MWLGCLPIKFRRTYPRRVAVINQVLDATPGDDPLRTSMIDTRGRIYVKMERWEDALVDLETALRQMPANPDLHRALATTYRGLGDETLAEEHERLAGHDR